MFASATSLVRYVFVFWLKNPAGFQDDFWHLFINLWIIGFNIVAQCASLPFQYKDVSAYQVCVGTWDPKETSVSIPYIYHVQIAIIALHVYIYGRLLLFKRKVKIAPTASPTTPRSLYLADLDQDAMIGIAETFWYILIVAFGISLNYAIKTFLDEKEFWFAANSMLITPSVAIFMSLITIHLRNPKMRQWQKREIKALLENLGEKMGLHGQPINVIT